MTVTYKTKSSPSTPKIIPRGILIYATVIFITFGGIFGLVKFIILSFLQCQFLYKYVLFCFLGFFLWVGQIKFIVWNNMAYLFILLILLPFKYNCFVKYFDVFQHNLQHNYDSFLDCSVHWSVCPRGNNVCKNETTWLEEISYLMSSLCLRNNWLPLGWCHCSFCPTFDLLPHPLIFLKGILRYYISDFFWWDLVVTRVLVPHYVNYDLSRMECSDDTPLLQLFATCLNMQARCLLTSEIGCAITQGLVLMQTIYVCWSSGH